MTSFFFSVLMPLMRFKSLYWFEMCSMALRLRARLNALTYFLIRLFMPRRAIISVWTMVRLWCSSADISEFIALRPRCSRGGGACLRRDSWIVFSSFSHVRSRREVVIRISNESARCFWYVSMLFGGHCNLHQALSIASCMAHKASQSTRGRPLCSLPDLNSSTDVAESS